MTADPVPLIEQSPTVCFLESETLSSRAGVRRSDDLPPAVQETKVRNAGARSEIHIRSGVEKRSNTLFLLNMKRLWPIGNVC